METDSRETRALRRTMRDLIALSALPAVLARQQPRQVAEGLCDVLLSMLQLDLVYLRVPGETGGPEICRTAGPPATTEQLRDIRTALAPWLEDIRTNSPPAIPNPMGAGTVHLLLAPIGLNRQHGVLIAGSQRTAFPNEEDRLLLSVATNQAAAVLQRLLAEEALRQSHSLLSAVIEGTPDAVFVKDTQGRYLLINTAGAGIAGRRPEEVLGKDDTELFEPETARAFREADRRVLEAGGVITYEDTIIAGGVTRAFVTTKGAHRDSQGRPLGVFGIARDITERKRDEAALRESNERFRIVTMATNDAVWDWDLKRNKVWWNDGVLTLFGYQLEYNEADPDWWLERIHPDDRQAVEAYFFGVVRGNEQFWVDEYRFRCADGSYKDVQDRGYVMRDTEGRATRMIGAMLDISERKRADGALRQAKEAAEAANRAKDEFLANVSHEIRTPMNAILGMTELALDTSLTDDQRQCLKTVKSAADNLLGMINDLLDFAKIEAGKLELAPGDFSLRATVHDTLRALATRAHKKGLELACNVQPDVPDALVGDAARLRQVLLNLVGNAIKFTEQGEVVVSVRMTNDGMTNDERSPNDEARRSHGGGTGPASALDIGDSSFFGHSSFVILHFEVKDTGIGIASDKQAKIFRAFEQEDASTTRKYGGTGLGLSIAARLVGLMGGSITVQSELGRGSTFAFTAQLGRQPYSTEQTSAWLPVLLKGLRVLVVDDNPTNRDILEKWLTGWHMEPVAVGDGLAALGALWDAISVGRPYPLVLLDARMPDTDGLALAARIRERAALSAVHIILLTSDHHRPGDAARSRALRIAAHLLKPVRQEELLETIYRVMTREKASEARGQEPGIRGQDSPPLTTHHSPLTTHHSPLTTHLHILLAEDDEFSAQLMDKLLTRRGHRVRLASNGREALALASRGAFDLMLLDVHLPELDGIEVAQGIREHERIAGGHLPVIALTARSRKEDRERCLAAGMDDFLTKPVSAANLLTAIDRVVGIRGQKSEVSDQKSEGGALLTSDLCPLTSEPGLLDPLAVLAACDDDAEALRGLCRALESYLPVRVAEVSDALRAQDAPRLGEAAHKLSALLLAFSQTAGRAASDLEDLAAEGRLEEARRLVERLEAMAEELLPLVRGLSLETLRRLADADDTGDQ